MITTPATSLLARLRQMAVPQRHDGPMVQALRQEAADLARAKRARPDLATAGGAS